MNFKTTHVAIIVYGEKSSSRISNILTKLNVRHTMLFPHDIPEFSTLFTHIILSGGPRYTHTSEDNIGHYLPRWIIKSKIPVLGIAYGMQLIVDVFGGVVERLPQKEVGSVKIVTLIEKDGKLFEQIDSVWMNRYDGITELPDTFEIISTTEKGDIAAITDNDLWWGVQYHPESDKMPHETTFTSFLKM